jgi:hypothetical protein
MKVDDRDGEVVLHVYTVCLVRKTFVKDPDTNHTLPTCLECWAQYCSRGYFDYGPRETLGRG